MPTPEEEREWQNTPCIPFTKYANPGDRNRGPGNEPFRNFLEQFQYLKSAIGEPLAYKLTYNLVGYIQRTPAKPGLESYNQRLWLIPVPKPEFEHQWTDLRATNLALQNQRLEWIVTIHYSIAMLFAESGHRVAGVPTGTPIETREEQEKGVLDVYKRVEEYHNGAGKAISGGWDKEMGMTKNGIIWLRNCQVKEPIPFTPESNLKVHDLVTTRFPAYTLEMCFLRAFPHNRIPQLHLTPAVDAKPAYLILIDRSELDRGRNPPGPSLTGLNTMQSTWIVTFDFNVAQTFEGQGGYTVMGVELWFEGEDLDSALYEIVDRLKMYYVGEGSVYFGGFYDGLEVTRNGMYWLRIARGEDLRLKAPRRFKSVAEVVRDAFRWGEC